MALNIPGAYPQDCLNLRRSQDSKSSLEKTKYLTSYVPTVQDVVSPALRLMLHMNKRFLKRS